MKVIHDRSLPVIAVWSLESPVFTCVMCVQRDGNEHRVIGSRAWRRSMALHNCIAGLKSFEWRNYDTHVTPPDKDGVWRDIFEKHGHYAEAAVLKNDAVRLTHELLGSVKIDSKHNVDLIEALRNFAPEDLGGVLQTFSVRPKHNLATHFSRCLELYACWNKDNQPGGAWGPAPNYDLQDLAVI